MQSSPNSKLGAHLPDRGSGRLCYETVRPWKQRQAQATIERGGRESASEVQRLYAKNDYLKNLQDLVLERATLGEKVQVVQKLSQKHPQLLLLEITQPPCATFYYHLKRMKKADKYAEAKAKIASIYQENKGPYGYCRITIKLNTKGIHLNHRRYSGL